MKECKHLSDREKISERVDYFNGSYHISGCCGGGCYVISNIVFCPFCGLKLKTNKEKIE